MNQRMITASITAICERNVVSNLDGWRRNSMDVLSAISSNSSFSEKAAPKPTPAASPSSIDDRGFVLRDGEYPSGPVEAFANQGHHEALEAAGPADLEPAKFIVGEHPGRIELRATLAGGPAISEEPSPRPQDGPRAVGVAADQARAGTPSSP